MAKISDTQIETVRALIAAIPPGEVSTYGDLAEAAGLTNPRQVGWILRTDGADLPWQRVVPASGRPTIDKATRQLDLLAAEGVPIHDGRILLRECRTRLLREPDSRGRRTES
ncbi:MGMT family protein [Gordonia alkaliphila]|uniref:MGMT family protein n=1 Tax=Gordonia alkaliphila TaxID=1053547 RepID=UPI001FF60CB8|nr:MGMT family protein [Gordonia alkaliphila]MCK0438273.1 MGMT family protein [Gordonia alkaliphila]